MTQATCDFRRRIQSTTGPLYLGKDTYLRTGAAIYAESSYDEAHLEVILGDAQEIVMNALSAMERP